MKRAVALTLLALAACDRTDPAEAPTPTPTPPAQAQPPAPAGPAPVTIPAAPVEAPTAEAAETEARTDDWVALAAQADRERVALLPSAWEAALTKARREHAAEIARLGALADPGVGLPRPQPAPGLYRCRTIKLGSRSPGPESLAYVAYPYFRCRVELTPGGDLTLTKLTGSQRVTGEFYPERDSAGRDTRRLIFLGAQAWGSDEASAPAYGENPERDQIGVLERIGEDRYRLALPSPRQESELDLMELVRVGN